LRLARRKVFDKCRTCHAVGAPTKFVKGGPHLNDLFGRKPGSLPDKKYSEELVAFGQDKVWDEATLTTFLRVGGMETCQQRSLSHDG
jgi:cytochrome c2